MFFVSDAIFYSLSGQFYANEHAQLCSFCYMIQSDILTISSCSLVFVLQLSSVVVHQLWRLLLLQECVVSF